MRGVMFGNVHSYDDLKLILSSLKIPPAVKKVNKISIPGRSGDLDISDFLGEAFENRTLEFEFTYRGNRKNHLSHQSFLENKINGKMLDVVIDEDGYKWHGRVSIKDCSEVNANIMSCSIEVDAEPYKENLTTGEKVL